MGKLANKVNTAREGSASLDQAGCAGRNQRFQTSQLGFPIDNTTYNVKLRPATCQHYCRIACPRLSRGHARRNCAHRHQGSQGQDVNSGDEHNHHGRPASPFTVARRQNKQPQYSHAVQIARPKKKRQTPCRRQPGATHPGATLGEIALFEELCISLRLGDMLCHGMRESTASFVATLRVLVTKATCTCLFGLIVS